MSRQLQPTPQQVDAILAQAKEDLLNKKFKSGNANLSITLQKDDDVAEVIFTPIAWVKMTELVSKFSTEVQWHGTVERLEPNRFLVRDILVFPHEVTGVTVTSKQEEYEEWQNNLDDETFNMLRLHGHSHVNMGVTPSSIDITLQESVLKGLATPREGYDPYYIFAIVNKRGELNFCIYDVASNKYYDEKEVLVDVCLGEEYASLSEFTAQAKHLATEPARQAGFRYGNSYNNVYTLPSPSEPPAKPEVKDKLHKEAKKNKHRYGSYQADCINDYYDCYGIEDEVRSFRT